MACNDDRGRDVLEACRAANLSVPEEVAVIGVDNDSLLCELADPPLSSVVLNAEHGGFEAAALLDRLMSGRFQGQERIVVEPLQVVTRRSTDVVALEDLEVAHALQFIHENAGRPIQVMEIVHTLGVSRRMLEIRFRRAIGKSMNEIIQQAHLERAKRLLLETDLPLPKVAEAAGYSSASYMAVVFHKAYAMTPARFRNRIAHSIRRQISGRKAAICGLSIRLPITTIKKRTFTSLVGRPGEIPEHSENIG